MSSLKDTLLAVRDDKLSLQQLEAYRDSLIHFFTDVNLEAADREKEEALYFMEHTKADVSDVSVKRMWRVTESGQRLILLNRYCKVLTKEIKALDSRVYSAIR